MRLGSSIETSLNVVGPADQPRRVALIGSYLPRPCGIATFSNDVYLSLKRARPDWDISVIAVNDLNKSYDYPEEVTFEVEPTPKSYLEAAQYIENRHFDAVFLQHEYGLFGGPAGDHLFTLLDNIRTPLLTMLHTVLREPDDDQFRVMRRLAARSSQVITMSPIGKTFLQDVFSIDEQVISVVPHGIPDTQYSEADQNKKQFGLQDRKVALTFGLLSPGKGIETAIAALPSVVEKNPDLTYVILGATHPHLVHQEGEVYRESLIAQVNALGLQDNVRFVNKFVELDELTRWLSASDIYLTPYLNEAQITSGTLSYAYGCGNAVISTPYWHAADLLKDGRGRLVKFNDSSSISDAMNELLGDNELRENIRTDAYCCGREMTWPVIGERLAELLQAANNQMFAQVDFPTKAPSVVPSTQSDPSTSLDGLTTNRSTDGKRLWGSANPMQGLKMQKDVSSPSRFDFFTRLEPQKPVDGEALHVALRRHVEVRLDHLSTLSDRVGIVQHATYDTPNWHEGYCTDDNVRSLLLLLELSRNETLAPGETTDLKPLMTAYRAFTNYAIDPTTGVARNFMSFDRQWLETRGSDDSIGRLAWTLGGCVDLGDDSTRGWAVSVFDGVLDQCCQTNSPRTWAFAMLGAAHYHRTFSGDRNSHRALIDLGTRLEKIFEHTADNDWLWYEDYLTYDNAKIPHAMMVAGQLMDRPDWIDIGLRSLDWLCRVQTAREGWFRPVGNQGFYQRGKAMAIFDQQPLEAWATLSATIEASKCDREISSADHWTYLSDLALAWFVGFNDLRTPIAVVETGACHDGLQSDRVNRNQGAESTLAWLFSASQWLAHDANQATAPESQVKQWQIIS